RGRSDEIPRLSHYSRYDVAGRRVFALVPVCRTVAWQLPGRDEVEPADLGSDSCQSPHTIRPGSTSANSLYALAWFHRERRIWLFLCLQHTRGAAFVGPRAEHATTDHLFDIADLVDWSSNRSDKCRPAGKNDRPRRG